MVLHFEVMSTHIHPTQHFAKKSINLRQKFGILSQEHFSCTLVYIFESACLAILLWREFINEDQTIQEVDKFKYSSNVNCIPNGKRKYWSEKTLPKNENESGKQCAARFAFYALSVEFFSVRLWPDPKAHWH